MNIHIQPASHPTFRWLSILVACSLLAAATPARAQPGNDLCIDAITIPECVDIAGTNIGAGTEGTTSCAASSRDVFYRFVPAFTANYTVTLCPTSDNWDTVLSIHLGCPADLGNEIACNDDFCGLRSQINAVPLTAATSYIIRVAGFGVEGLNDDLFILRVCATGMSTSGACCCLNSCTCTFMASASTCTCSGCKTGVWFAGRVCAPLNSCTLRGACCDQFQSCLLTEPGDCPGTFLCVGEACIPIDHCNTLQGACCEGATCTLRTANDCGGPNMRFLGAGTACNVPGNDTSPCCYADFNQSNVISVQDIFDFLAAFFNGNPNADYNDTGSLSVQDLFDFLAGYFGGCT